MWFAKREKSTTPQTVLSPYDYARIERCIVSEQLDFFKDVLLVSLRIIQSGLQTQGDDAFKTVFEAILKGLTRVYAYIEPRKTALSRANMNAQLALTFYRIAYQQTAHLLQHENGFSPLRLLKRLPAKLALYLGDQDWRLFEFYTVVFSPLPSCVINADIVSQLTQYCIDCCPVVQSASPALASTTVANKAAIAAPKPQAPTGKLAAQTPAPATPTASVAPPSPTKATTLSTLPTKDVGEVLRRWALKNTAKDNKRFAINGGLYFYAAPLAFGEKTLFINQAGIAHFLRSHTGTLASIVTSPLIEPGYKRQGSDEALLAITLASPLANVKGNETIEKKEGE